MGKGTGDSNLLNTLPLTFVLWNIVNEVLKRCYLSISVLFALYLEVKKNWAYNRKERFLPLKFTSRSVEMKTLALEQIVFFDP